MQLEFKEDPSSGRPTLVGFDHHDPALAADPYSVWKELRERCPVSWTEANGGHWVVTDYESAFRVFRDDMTFKSGDGVAIPAPPIKAIPIETDAPQTQQYRRMLQEELSPAGVRPLADSIRITADRLLDEVIERGSADIVEEFANPVTAITILRCLGIAEDRWEGFVATVHKIVHEVTSDPDGVLISALALYEEIAAEITDRREHPKDDFVSRLVASEIDGAPMTDQQVGDYVLLLIFGGLDTTSTGIANAMVRMAQNPGLREQLLETPDLRDAAIEEFLRIDSPNQTLARTVTADVELGGQRLCPGDRLLVVHGAANRDPREFPDPDAVDFQRESNRHLAFGVGLHRCIGSNLGRLMFRTMLDVVLERIPDWTLTDAPETHRIEDVGNVYGLKHLPIGFTPSQRLSEPRSA